ncbi:micronuclear linker histone polyprotein [Spatholobus suberectus]|nr:micronuclear linker histone polyprotein [Spatholobus suberectus]
MEKSSSSLKKKRSKKLSKAKASGKSRKSKKYKSKKVHRHEVSLCCSDYDDSKSLDTSDSSSSEDSYRRKRDRSRTRKDVKGRKRKARERSYSRDGREDSNYAKRKKAKRKNEHDEVRKKPFQKKKIRREASVDSMSSRSRSCSTCQDGSTSRDDSRYKSRGGRLERKEKDRRRLRGRSESKKSSRYRARSCSSCSPDSENSYEVTEEKYVGENNSRWLRSVITVTKEAEEYGELCRNETKEEIVDDHDYPCRSNDSNDGGTKRELDHHTLLASEEKLRVEDEAGDMNADLSFTEPKLRDRSYNDCSNLKAYSAGTSESMKETGGTSGANVNDDDLEAILRQRALENLRKFRGEIQSSAKAPDQKNKTVSQVKQPITDKHEVVQGKSVVNDSTVGTKFVKRTPGEETNLPVGRRNLIACPKNNERILNTDKDISGSAKCDLACAPEKVIDSDNPSGTFTESTNYNTANLELTKQTQKSCHNSLQTSASHEPTNAKLPVAR